MSAYIKTDADAPFVQVLNGHEVWLRCTPKQRELLRGLLVVINDRKKSRRERFAVRNKIEAPPRTLASRRSREAVGGPHTQQWIDDSWGFWVVAPNNATVAKSTRRYTTERGARRAALRMLYAWNSNGVRVVVR